MSNSEYIVNAGTVTVSDGGQVLVSDFSFTGCDLQEARVIALTWAMRQIADALDDLATSEGKLGYKTTHSPNGKAKA